MEKKILMFTEVFANGGIEKVIYDINKNKSSKYEIINLCVNNYTTVFNDIDVKSLLNKNYKKAIIRNLFSMLKFKKFLKNNKFDIIHINTHWAFGYIWAFWARKYVDKIIVHAHTSGIENDRLGIKKFINTIIKKIFYSKKNLCIACSKEAGDFCLGNVDYKIIYNGINTKKFLYNANIRKIEREKLGLNDDDFVIGNVGRFESQKNHTFLIRVFNELYKKNKKVFLIIIGKGSQKEKILKMINEYSLENRVKIIDSSRNIEKYYNIFDMFVFPTLFEGFPISLLEAQTSSLCCLISDNIDKNAIISNSTYVIPLDVQKWVETFFKYMLYDRTNVKINMSFDFNNTLRKIEKIYEL